MLGRHSHDIINSYKSAGYYESVWDASDFASGVYFIHFNSMDNKAGSTSQIQKLILMK